MRIVAHLIAHPRTPRALVNVLARQLLPLPLPADSARVREDLRRLPFGVGVPGLAADVARVSVRAQAVAIRDGVRYLGLRLAAGQRAAAAAKGAASEESTGLDLGLDVEAKLDAVFEGYAEPRDDD